MNSPLNQIIQKLDEIDANGVCCVINAKGGISYSSEKFKLITAALRVACESLEEYDDLHYAPKLQNTLKQIAEKLKG